MITLKHAEKGADTPGTWRPLQNGYQRSASVICPNGHHGLLLDHEIAEDGTVSPSVQCPWSDCNWHEMVKLEGWPP